MSALLKGSGGPPANHNNSDKYDKRDNSTHHMENMRRPIRQVSPSTAIALSEYCATVNFNCDTATVNHSFSL